MFNRFGATLLVSMSVLFVEAVLGLLTLMIVSETEASPSVGPHPLGLAVIVVVGVPLGAVLGFVLSVAAVMPLVVLGSWLGRRFGGGRDRWWWTPVAAGAVVCVPVAAVGLPAGAGVVSMAWTWLALTAVLAVPALAVRPVALRPVQVHGGRAFARVALYGTGAVVGLCLLSWAAFETGLLREYHPPRVSEERLAGTWTDGRGGTLRLAADGTATATGLDHHTFDDDFDDVVEECTGSGTWSYDAGESEWSQTVAVSAGGCSEKWEVGGTPDRVTLYVFVGDPDSGDLYELGRAG
ncbi:hypothetical protein [Streptomyces sp. NPDC015131]|uniref:hypothetical protein n=1 Tax=Streptomyces sp. NPDC015131 TaxID=3364941 RepID=UPI0037031A0F